MNMGSSTKEKLMGEDIEYMGLSLHSASANMKHYCNDQQGGRLQRSFIGRRRASSTSSCVLAICGSCFVAILLLFGTVVMNIHRRSELGHVLRDCTLAPSSLFNLFNIAAGPSSAWSVPGIFLHTSTAAGGADHVALPQQLLSRTLFHYQPQKNWMNGPMYYMGYYHLFHQYNKSMPLWGVNMSWAHAVSKDLIHWLYLEVALEPDQEYDAMGVWSGSSTIGPNGIPFIIYTGKMNQTCEETQNMAVPADPSDPLLRKWVKVPQNPIVRRPAAVLDPWTFRDPTSAWQEEDGSWVFTVGSVIGDTNTTGAAFLFKSKDLRHWEQLDKPLITSPETGMWECVDFYPVGFDSIPQSSTLPAHNSSHKYVFKRSLFTSRHDVYTLGSYAAHTFTPDNPELDNIGFESFCYDCGVSYASDSFFDPVKQRRIVLAWVNGSETTAMAIERGWAGFLSIPRTVAVDSKTGVNLIQWPIEEVELLRTNEQVQTGLKLDASALVKVDGTAGSQLDVEIVFDYPDVSMAGAFTDEAKYSMNDEFNCSQGGSAHRGIFGPFGLLVLTDENFQEQTAEFFYIGRSGKGEWITRFCSDASRSSLLPDVGLPVYGSPVKVLPTEDFLSVRILVDQFIVESFVQGGRLVITSRVYPTVATHNLAKLYLFNNGTTPITVRKITTWHMSEVIMHPY
ncbi:unnamed protein product [Sphagnum jensenii]|uniref:Uncharacterized protein n=1 Tax=Sphagnum jensenii TaxID=128206 RepID=A0ABP1BJV7_9BRYO